MRAVYAILLSNDTTARRGDMSSNSVISRNNRLLLTSLLFSLRCGYVEWRVWLKNIKSRLKSEHDPRQILLSLFHFQYKGKLPTSQDCCEDERHCVKCLALSKLPVNENAVIIVIIFNWMVQRIYKVISHTLAHAAWQQPWNVGSVSSV